MCRSEWFLRIGGNRNGVVIMRRWLHVNLHVSWIIFTFYKIPIIFCSFAIVEHPQVGCPSLPQWRAGSQMVRCQRGRATRPGPRVGGEARQWQSEMKRRAFPFDAAALAPDAPLHGGDMRAADGKAQAGAGDRRGDVALQADERL